MVLPGGLSRPENVKIEIRKYKTGLYTLKNAYAGDYEYFPGEVLIKDAGMPVTDNVGQVSTTDEKTPNTVSSE